MHIAFIDPMNWQYTIDAPYERPFGGSQSALCYLAAELARLGHAVTIFNANPTPSESRGVMFTNIAGVKTLGALNTFEAVVVVNSVAGRDLRRDFRASVPLVTWIHHHHGQPAVHELRRLNDRKSWSGFAFVSDWQLGNFAQTYWVPRGRSRVMRNAVSPAFIGRPAAAPWFATGEPPTLFYSSTPFRGLDVLLQAFPAIRAAVPGTRLRVFSSMGVYQMSPEEDQYRELYAQARQMDGVEYVGSVGQSRLAQEIAGAAALAYPSTFAETSCITALEAMAVGAAVFTTRLGALPETTNGLASMVDAQPDKARLAESFAAMAISALREMRQDPVTAAARRDARIQYVAENYQWPARAHQWVEWLSQLRGAERPAAFSSPAQPT